MKRLLFVLTFTVLLCGHPSTGISATLRVPSEYPTIQAGIDAAVDGDTVLVADGTYTGEGNKDNNFNGKVITVLSEGGASNCIIDCEGEGKGFHFQNDETASSILDGFTIQNGNGAITLWYYSSPTLRNLIIQDHTGGGIGIGEGCSPMIMNCILRRNYSPRNGGAISGTWCSAQIINCQIVDNSAVDSGGGCSFSTGSVDFMGCLFSNNSAEVGGALNVTECGGDILDCVFTGNTASEMGGGITFYGSARSLMQNCIVANNQTSGTGGGIHCMNAWPVIKNSTIVNNWALNGGGIRIYEAAPQVKDCIFWGNTIDQISLYESSYAKVTYCDVEGGWPGQGNIDEDPHFVVGSGGEYYLSQTAAGQQVTSACVDAGSDFADSIWYPIPSGAVLFSQLTTRSDQVVDSGMIDIGYHYYPETYQTPTPGPTFTTGPTHSPVPTPTFAPTIPPPEMNLYMPENYFSPGDVCWLRADIENWGEELENVPTFILLSVYEEYWYWDDWTQEIDYQLTDLIQGKTIIIAIDPFFWPDTGSQTMRDLWFLGALTNSEMTEIIGGLVGISVFGFGYGPG